MSDTQYHWWHNALAGRRGDINPNEPQSGFYRYRSKKTGKDVPVAYWCDGAGDLHCRYSKTSLDQNDAVEIWPYASKNPITHEVYKAVIERGMVNAAYVWPNQHEAVIGHNNAPIGDDLASIKDRIEDLSREAEKLIAAGAATSQDAADRASDLANTFGELKTKADELRKAEKKPHDDGAAAVQTKWKPLVDLAEDFKTKIKRIVLDPWFKKQEDAAKAAGVSAPKIVAGSSKRSTAPRTYYTAEICDRSRLVTFLLEQENAVFLDCLQDIANASAKNQVALPGCRVLENKRAA